MSHACQCKACAEQARADERRHHCKWHPRDRAVRPEAVADCSGFLLCQDVPIARIGTQEYADVELPDIEPSDDGIIVVERHEDDVFDPESIASFEGAPVTIEHPREPVTPDNWIVYAKG
jgi:hypothetical protein